MLSTVLGVEAIEEEADIDDGENETKLISDGVDGGEDELSNFVSLDLLLSLLSQLFNYIIKLKKILFFSFY